MENYIKNLNATLESLKTLRTEEDKKKVAEMLKILLR